MTKPINDLLSYWLTCIAANKKFRTECSMLTNNRSISNYRIRFDARANELEDGIQWDGKKDNNLDCALKNSIRIICQSCALNKMPKFESLVVLDTQI